MPLIQTTIDEIKRLVDGLDYKKLDALLTSPDPEAAQFYLRNLFRSCLLNLNLDLDGDLEEYKRWIAHTFQQKLLTVPAGQEETKERIEGAFQEFTNTLKGAVEEILKHKGASKRLSEETLLPGEAKAGLSGKRPETAIPFIDKNDWIAVVANKLVSIYLTFDQRKYFCPLQVTVLIIQTRGNLGVFPEIPPEKEYDGIMKILEEKFSKELVKMAPSDGKTAADRLNGFMPAVFGYLNRKRMEVTERLTKSTYDERRTPRSRETGGSASAPVTPRKDFPSVLSGVPTGALTVRGYPTTLFASPVPVVRVPSGARRSLAATSPSSGSVIPAEISKQLTLCLDGVLNYFVDNYKEKHSSSRFKNKIADFASLLLSLDQSGDFDSFSGRYHKQRFPAFQGHKYEAVRDSLYLFLGRETVKAAWIQVKDGADNFDNRLEGMMRGSLGVENAFSDIKRRKAALRRAQQEKETSPEEAKDYRKRG